MSFGLFGLAGGVTNWVAVYMLFEKVPYLYGSGVIPTRYVEIRSVFRLRLLSREGPPPLPPLPLKRNLASALDELSTLLPEI